MSDAIRNVGISNPRVAELAAGRTAPVAPNAPAGPDFKTLLDDRLKLSGHAKTRLDSRQIQLDAQAWERVVAGVEKAAQKGAKESLVLVDDAALIVSVKNRTVITAVEKAQLKDNVFTNIDSAVIVSLPPTT